MTDVRSERWLAMLIPRSLRCGFTILVLAIVVLPGSASAQLPSVLPADVGIDAGKLGKIRDEVGKEITARQLPGCVVLIARHGKVVFLEAFGNRQIEPETVAMTVDTVFDLASLTKPIATATTVFALAERGQLALEDRVVNYIPEFGENGKDSITIEQLLTHQSGLMADNPIADYAEGHEVAIRRICALPLEAEPAKKFIYSDVGFIVLGEVIRRIDSRGLAEVSQELIFRRLGMRETTFLPTGELKKRCAPTEKRANRWLQGEVHDPRAEKLGGVAGHAGLFSTAKDLAVFAQMILDHGRYGNLKVLAPDTIQQLIAPVAVPGGVRTRGWDMRTGYSHIRGQGMSDASFGHGGFTGTGIWIDPERELFVIFLSNRVHPDGKGKVNPLIGRICTLTVEAAD